MEEMHDLSTKDSEYGEYAKKTYQGYAFNAFSDAEKKKEIKKLKI